MVQYDDIPLRIDRDTEYLSEVLIGTDLEKIRIRFEWDRWDVVEDRHVLIRRLQWWWSRRRRLALGKHRNACHSQNGNEHTQCKPSRPAFHNKPPGRILQLAECKCDFPGGCYSSS